METKSPMQADDSTLVLPVVREQVQVGTRTIDTGRGVRIHKTVSEHPHNIDEMLLRDALDVQRIAVDQIVSLSEAPVTRQEGDTLIVPILEEVLVIEKKVRIKEEIHITRSHSHERHVDTVLLKQEDVSIERFDESPVTEANSTTRR